MLMYTCQNIDWFTIQCDKVEYASALLSKLQLVPTHIQRHKWNIKMNVAIRKQEKKWTDKKKWQKIREKKKGKLKFLLLLLHSYEKFNKTISFYSFYWRQKNEAQEIL